MNDFPYPFNEDPEPDHGPEWGVVIALIVVFLVAVVITKIFA
jgi:hypothetical protein